MPAALAGLLLRRDRRAKGTPAYPADGDALLAELRALVDTVPQQTNREANAAEIAAYHGQMLFYFDRDYYTLAELVHLPERGKYSACVYIDADGAATTAPAMPAASRCSWTNGGGRTASPLTNRPCPPIPCRFATMASLTRWKKRWATCTPACTTPDSVLC